MGATVLLADAAKPYRESVAQRLTNRGVRVVEVESAEHAERALEENYFDVAVVDNGLVDRAGTELVAKIRPQYPDLPIILVVEPTFGSDQDAEQNGSVCLLRGPIHPHALCGHIDEMYEKGSLFTPEPEPTVPRESQPAGKEKTLDSHLKVIRKSYQQKLPGELEILRKALRQIEENPEDKPTMRRAHRIAHTLHGTAGTLGFTEVSLAAGEIEEGLKRLMEGSVLFDSAWQSITDALELAVTAPERPSLVETVESKVMGIATVLLVDVDRDMTASIEALARKNLVSIVPAKNHDEALDALKP